MPTGYFIYTYDAANRLATVNDVEYSPDAGRFLTKDTWQGDDILPMSYNAWLYGYANPLSFGVRYPTRIRRHSMLGSGRKVCRPEMEICRPQPNLRGPDSSPKIGFRFAVGWQRPPPHSRMWMMAAYIVPFIIHQSSALRPPPFTVVVVNGLYISIRRPSIRRARQPTPRISSCPNQGLPQRIFPLTQSPLTSLPPPLLSHSPPPRSSSPAAPGAPAQTGPRGFPGARAAAVLCRADGSCARPGSAPGS
jgi:hypothetical protein